MEIPTSIGLAVFMPNCSFQVEISRESISETIKDIDNSLNEVKCPKDKQTRSLLSIQNAISISEQMSNSNINNEDGVREITFAFLYAYSKQVGKVHKKIRGISAYMAEDHVDFSTYLESDGYEVAIDQFKMLHADVLGDNVEDATPEKPTIH